MRVIPLDLNKDYSDVIAEAIDVLKWGGVIVYPTDTVYGLGANALNETAVSKIFGIKNRDTAKALPILARNIVWVEKLAHIDPRNRKALEKIWPGAATAILPKKNIIPLSVTGGTRTVGIRIPNYPFLDQLLAKFGYPLTSTSANISGEEPGNDINKIISLFSDRFPRPELIIDAGILPKSLPSMVIDLTGDHPKILRVGPSKPEQLLKLLEI